ncbi:hypothetical protein DPMN_155786 [Dreissena polymorpha]|uniref:Uncharacterized protein n=1 Tax=Dreissena polymorpha TaxID=45954 RepID=A0A9D4JBP4_DREPO|nr:hypothetical protein DPMN_155786 [Dreissena polymorpha]
MKPATQRVIQTCLVRTAPPVVIACSEQVVTKVLVTVLVTFVHLDGLKATVALPVIKAFLVTTAPSHAIVYMGKDVTMFLATILMINVPLAGLIVIVALSVIAYTELAVTMSPVTVTMSNVSMGGPRVTVALPATLELLVLTALIYAIVTTMKLAIILMVPAPITHVQLDGRMATEAKSVIAYTELAVTMSPVTVTMSNVSLGGLTVTVALPATLALLVLTALIYAIVTTMKLAIILMVPAPITHVELDGRMATVAKRMSE